MKIELKDFKCFDYYCAEFISTGLILVEGASGVGKTTLVNAILFAINNSNSSKITNKQACVTLTLEECKIIRTKYPCRLILEVNNKILYDDEAQAWIESNIHVCVIAQNGYDDFILANANDRRNLLESLAGLHSQQTIVFEEKLHSSLKKINNDCIVKLAEKNLLEQQLATSECGKQAIGNVDVLVAQLEQDKIQFGINENEIKNFNSKQKQQQRLKELNIELESLKMQTVGHETRAAQFVLAKNANLRSELLASMPPTTLEAINGEIDRLVEEKISIEKNNLKFEESLKIQKEYNDMSDWTLICPWETCQQGIVVDGYNFSKASNEQICLGKRKRTMEESEKFHTANKFLKTSGKKYFDYEKLIQLQSMQQQVACIERQLLIIGNNYSSDLDFLNLQKKVEQDSKNLKRIEIIQQALETFPNVSLVGDAPPQPISYDELVHREHLLKKIIDENNKFLLFQKLEATVQTSVQQYAAVVEQQTRILLLNKIWQETKTSCIENITAILQHKVNVLLDQFFTFPISILISCWKSATKNRGEKPGFEISLVVKNRPSSIAELSGGEKARLSIALSCALCELKQSPLLILDEAMAGLDFENIQRVTKSLSKWALAFQKTIIVVSHNSLKGVFNQVVSL
jgi:energy-coupling factor transporter ATP-binding protein EcfA2